MAYSFKTGSTLAENGGAVSDTTPGSHFLLVVILYLLRKKLEKTTWKVCIDEGIRLWKGIIQGKPHPNGIKIYIIADETNYVYDFWIYCSSQPPTAYIVVDFINRLPGQYPTSSLASTAILAVLTRPTHTASTTTYCFIHSSTHVPNFRPSSSSPLSIHGSSTHM